MEKPIPPPPSLPPLIDDTKEKRKILFEIWGEIANFASDERIQFLYDKKFPDNENS